MRTALALLACIVLLASCQFAPKHPFVLSEDADPASVQKLYVAPISATSQLADEVRAGADRVQEQIDAYLEAHGRTFSRGALYMYQNEWGKSFRNVELEASPRRAGEAPPPPPVAIANLIRALRTRYEFDTLLVPDLLVRPARLGGRIARWDGVTRVQESSRTVRWTGETNALSLRVRLFREDGQMIFEGIGGLDMLFRVDYVRSRAVPLTDILAVPENVAEGVAIAFHPFLPLPEGFR